MLPEKSICGLDSNALNELLECCTDPSHVVPDGSKVVEATLVPSSLDQELEMDMKLWDFDPTCFLDTCKDSHADSVTPPSLTHSEELNNTPCCSKEMMLCDLDEHLSNKELNHLDNLLACCIDNEGTSIDYQPSSFLNPPPLATFNARHASSDSIKLENTSDIRDTLRTRNTTEEQQQYLFPQRHLHHHHHHHLLHLHHHDPTSNEQVHAHDLIFHHHTHDTKDFTHHHHLKIPEGFNGQHIQREFILPHCKNKAPVLKSSILDENSKRCANFKIHKAGGGGCCDKRRNSPLDIEQNKKLLHDRLHNHLIQHHRSAEATEKPVSHVKIGQEDKECQWLDCNETVNPTDINEHILQRHLYDLPIVTSPELYKCEWKDCSFTFEDIDQLYDHIPSHTEVDHESHIKHICKWINTDGVRCNHEFPDTEALTTHLIEEHVGGGQSKYECQWENCDRNHKPFNQRQKIIRHLNTHTKHKPFKCEICNRTFSLELMLKQHMRTHTGETPYKCDECDKEFKTSSSLTIHKRVHSGIKPMECKICGKRFNESSNLNKHMKIHSRKYKCQHCHKSFNVKEKFQRHQLVCKPSTFSI